MKMTKEEKKLVKKWLQRKFKKQKPFAHILLSFKIWKFAVVDKNCIEINYSTYFKPLYYPILIFVLTPIIFICYSFNEQISFQEVWCDLFLAFKKEKSYTKKFMLEEEDDI